MVADADQHRFGCTALLDNKQAALLINPAQQLALAEAVARLKAEAAPPD